MIVHGDSIISKGIYYSTDENLTIENCDSVITITDTNSLNSDLCQIRLELKQGTLYYLHGFAKNKDNKTKYGKKEQFKTLGESLLEPEIEITTLPVKDITKTTAISEGNITHKKNVDISIVGICWSQTENPTIEDYRNESQYKSDSFELQLSNLEPNTQYYVRSYAITDIGIIYGNVQSFRSLHDGTFIIFEDSNFETFCLWNFDSNKDGQISIGEVDKITELDISRKNISTIPEIQYFTSLTTLDCSNNQLTSLDMSGCTSLQTLNCSYNQLTSLDVSGYTSLQTLNCNHCNSMTFLNVSGCTSLMTLNCKNCLSPLSLNASGCTSLAKFDYRIYKEDDTRFTYLNMSGCTNLRYLDCRGGHLLTYLNVSGCTNLEELNCKYNDNLTFLDASKCVSLKILECGSLKLSSLNVSECTKLWKLDCSNNQLTSLNVSECTKLGNLDCRSNQLTSLNVDGCTNLDILDCGNNQLTSLDVRRCTNLTYLYCMDNPNLTTLYMRSSQHLNHIYKDSFTQIIYK